MKPFLTFLLPEKLEIDIRTPLFSFDLPFVDVKYGFYAPSIIFWIETLWLLALQGLVSASLSIIAYKFIIQKRGTTLSYLVGFGIIIPIWILLPSYELVALDVRNKIMKFCMGGIIPTLGIFHTTEAMFACEPAYASESISAFAQYWASPMMLLFEPKSRKHVKSTMADCLRHLGRFALFLCVSGALQSSVTPSHYSPFSSAEGDWYAIHRLLDLNQLGNNAIHALMFQMYLLTFAEGLIVASMLLFGYKTETVMENPLLKSTSPSEFWGRRWNKLVHGVLKRGVYLPVRKSFPKVIAVWATFLASGVFHEWLLTGVFVLLAYELNDDGTCTPPKCYRYVSGGSTAFLLWNGLMLMAEALIGKSKFIQWIAQTFPRPVRSFMVVMLALPMGHWFCDPYVKSNYFEHGQLAFPMVLPLSSVHV